VWPSAKQIKYWSEFQHSSDTGGKWEYKEAVHRLFTDFRRAYNSVRMEVLYSIFIEFGVPMKLVWIIKVCLNETYIEVSIGKHLPDKECRILGCCEMWLLQEQTFERNICFYKSHIVYHPRRWHYSWSPLWKPQILHFSDNYPIKICRQQRDALSPLLFKLCLGICQLERSMKTG
jgi:hypothetical protein